MIIAVIAYSYCILGKCYLLCQFSTATAHVCCCVFECLCVCTRFCPFCVFLHLLGRWNLRGGIPPILESNSSYFSSQLAQLRPDSLLHILHFKLFFFLILFDFVISNKLWHRANITCHEIVNTICAFKWHLYLTYLVHSKGQCSRSCTFQLQMYHMCW